MVSPLSGETRKTKRAKARGATAGQPIGSTLLDKLKAQAGSEKRGPELVFALVGAVGAQLTQAANAIRDALREVDYLGVKINVLDVIRDQPEWKLESTHGDDEEMRARMDCGNKCRATLERPDALALFSIAAIQERRRLASGHRDKSIPRTAYILRSLKTPEEVECLRKTYGDSCYIVAVYCPHDVRRENLAKRIAESHHSDRERYFGKAEDLINRDMREPGEAYGQNLRDAFPEADVFLDGTSIDALTSSTQRFVEIVFQHPFRTPTREEVGMFQAYGAKLRSAQAGRQVGASITRDGEIVCIGTNEVGKAFGGQYWEGDPHDGRDHRRSDDSTRTMTESLFADLLARLREKGWLSADKEKSDLKQLLDAAKNEKVLRRMKSDREDSPPSLAEKAQILDLIEFMRAVHAEMAALVNAARLGTRTEGCELFCTAFPCHECARHIVAAGIKRVYFIEPYPKSRVGELFDDSIAIDDDDPKRVRFRAFTGVAPRFYSPAFIAPRRRDSQDRWLQWDNIKKTATPGRAEPGRLAEREEDLLTILSEVLKAKSIELKGESDVELAKEYS
jgi:deoxycytidylate deaminase